MCDAIVDRSMLKSIQIQAALPATSSLNLALLKSSDATFAGGMKKDATALADRSTMWDAEYQNNDPLSADQKKVIHCVILVAGTPDLNTDPVNALIKSVVAAFGSSIALLKTETGNARDQDIQKRNVKGHEQWDATTRWPCFKTR